MKATQVQEILEPLHGLMQDEFDRNEILPSLSSAHFASWQLGPHPGAKGGQPLSGGYFGNGRREAGPNVFDAPGKAAVAGSFPEPIGHHLWRGRRPRGQLLSACSVGAARGATPSTFSIGSQKGLHRSL